MAEAKTQDSVQVVSYEYLSESEDDDFEYEEVPPSEDEEDDDVFNFGAEETLASIEKSVERAKRLDKEIAQNRKEEDWEEGEDDDPRVEGKRSEHASTRQKERPGIASARESKTVVRPAVIDDFFRSFLIKLKLNRTLDTFNTEWYELESKGKLKEEEVGAVPDIYIRNQELDEMVKTLRIELDRMKVIAEKAQSTWDKFRKERDFHRLHHKRVVQEKNKLIGEIKRIKKHYQTYEPTIEQLRQKYELAMKERMLMKIEKDKMAARNESLEMQMRSIEPLEDGQDTQSTRISGKGKSSTALTNSASSPMKKNSTSIRSVSRKTTGPPKQVKRSNETYLPDMDPPNPFLDQVFEAPSVKNMQMLKTFEGHVNAVSALAYHPRKQVIATASDDHTWKLWSVPNGELIMSGEGHQDWVAGIDFNPKGTHLLSSAGDGTIKLWDFERAQCTVTLTDHAQPVWDVSWHYTGDFFASGSMDHTTKLWDVESHRVRQTFRGHVDSVNAVQFQPYSSNICTASGDKTVSMWDSRSGLCIQTFFGHNNSCNSLSMNLRGDTIASCDADGVVKLWDVRMVKEIYSLDGGSHALNDLAFDKSGSVLAAASDDGTIKMFDTASGQLISQLRGHDDAVQAVVFDPSLKFFISAGSDNTFRMWKI